MSGKLFNFLCSQLERKNSRRTIDLSVNLIFRRIHVYQNGHVPIYRFPSVFFIFFSQKEFFMLTNGTTYQTANRLDRFVGFENYVMAKYFLYRNNIISIIKPQVYPFFRTNCFLYIFFKRRKAAYYRYLAKP